ncbi:hypothetical protein P691DRAFT_104190 [Macrolepiota fuliginosa MF-IS2]|uniref:Uncharacterized protein n=1 Tax=Macrolepiota fuliginosa MF-IS2 TaxID=1400762 RepID=A0A9P5XAU1_9AGAR|nr:hypothetical protein P691DRAFT_104190 [Macrolepiota fuliginosa MF-IS2]
MKPIAIPPAMYATASEQNDKPITLQGQNPGNSRQIWHVKIVDEKLQTFNIERADLVWLPPEYPPSFGILGGAADFKPVSCLEGVAKNPKWKIIHDPPKEHWLQQAKFAIFPYIEEIHGPEYFVDDGMGIKGDSLNQSQEMILRFLGSAQTHNWYFEPVFTTQV